MGTRATVQEQERARKTFEQLFSDPRHLPFSFQIGEKKYHGFDEDFHVARIGVGPKYTCICDNTFAGIQGKLRDAIRISGFHKDRIKVTVEAVLYAEYAAYEWTLFFENLAEEDTPLIHNIQAVELPFNENDPRLHYMIGDDNMDEHAWEPWEIPLLPGISMEFEPVGGRPTQFQLPYYKLQCEDRGYMLSVSWCGQWKSKFDARVASKSERKVVFTAAQAEFAAKLHSGESIRTPMITVLSYDGADSDRGTNLWRRWFQDCNLCHFDGEALSPMVGVSNMSDKINFVGEQGEFMTTECAKRRLDSFFENDIPVDIQWMDAGWYYKASSGRPEIWQLTGNLEPDTDRFPDRFKEISENAAKHGAKFLLWFEPERVTPGTDTYEHEEWCIPEEWRTDIFYHQTSRLADFGNDAFREWVTEKIDKIITEGGVSIYREDCNIDTLLFWRYKDFMEGPDRIGMAENKFVVGHFQFWDELRRRHPGLVIDTCASGGLRLDLETLRRAVPLHRTDSYGASRGYVDQKQALSHSFPKIMTYFGCVSVDSDKKNDIRSAFSAALILCMDLTDPAVNVEEIRSTVNEWRAIKHCYFYDYYPLTEWSYDPSCWIGWEYYDDDAGEGIVQMFRRRNCTEDRITVQLRGLTADATYRLHDFDAPDRDIQRTGSELMQGFEIVLPEKESSALFHILPQK